MLAVYRSVDFQSCRTYWASPQVARPYEAVLTTVAAEGGTDSRIVLLRSLDDSGCVFYTNYRSAKACQIAVCPQVCLSFWWPKQRLLCHGQAMMIETEASEAYFTDRPHSSQCAARVSIQSAALPHPQLLRMAMYRESLHYAGQVVPRPVFWGGYRIALERVLLAGEQEGLPVSTTPPTLVVEHHDYCFSRLSVADSPQLLWRSWSAEAFDSSATLACCSARDPMTEEIQLAAVNHMSWADEDSVVLSLGEAWPVKSSLIGQRVHVLWFHSEQERQCRLQAVVRHSTDAQWFLQIIGVEFWQGRPSRLHDRLYFRRDRRTWSQVYLYP